MGNAHEDVLTAFEATLKTVYLYKVASRLPDAEETELPKFPANREVNRENRKKWALGDDESLASCSIREGFYRYSL